MDIRKQTSSRQTKPASRSACRINACPLMPFDRTRNLSATLVCLSFIVLVWDAGNLGHAVQAAPTAETSGGEDLQSNHVVTGTLDQLDFNTGKGLLKTDVGKPVFFQMVRPELFRRLSIGQRVTIGMNEQDQAIKVVEIPPVELPKPPSTGN